MSDYLVLALLAQDHINDMTEQAGRHHLANALRRGRRKLQEREGASNHKHRR